MRVKFWYTNYATNIAQKDFTIIVTDTCETPTLTASTLSNEIYTINSGSASSPAFASFLTSPTYCPVTYAITGISPALPSDGVSTITLDSATRVFSFSSTNSAAEATYTVTAACFTPTGTNTGTAISFDIEF